MGEKDPGRELASQGLKPLQWADVLNAIQAKLTPEDWKTFTRLHRNFVGYSSEATLTRFYDFVFSRGLQLDVNCFRFHRLEKILAGLSAQRSGARILDVGAGAGIVAEAARKWLSPSGYAAQDICAEARAHLAAKGLRVLPHPPAAAPIEPFDLILCADSLGELNSDEDRFLSDPENARHPLFAEAVEERYGFAQKLETWRAWLAGGGSLLLWEPIANRAVWEALAGYLGASWKTRLDISVPGGEFLELSSP